MMPRNAGLKDMSLEATLDIYVLINQPIATSPSGKNV
jgi:hypothetical protein